MYEASVNYKELRILKKAKVISSPFESPLLKLIDCVYKKHADTALFILRQRIQLNYTPTEFEKALIKVCAKRFTSKEFLVDLKSLKNLTHKQVTPKNILTPVEAMQLALKQSFRSRTNDRKYKSDRQIGAVLLDSNFNLLSTGYNKSSTSKNYHAEFVCLKKFWKKNKTFIPKGSKLFVTLKPCRMCSALLYDFSDNPHSLEIFYLHDDTGPFAQNTLLENVTKKQLLP